MKEHRGCGYGKKLFEAALELIKGEGCNMVSLEARNEFVEFYEKRGFRAESACWDTRTRKGHTRMVRNFSRPELAGRAHAVMEEMLRPAR